VQASDKERIVHVAVVDGQIYVLLQTKKGTTRTALVVYDEKLAQRYRLELDDSGRRYYMPGWGRDTWASSSWKVVPTAKVLLTEEGAQPGQLPRIGLRAPATGKLKGTVSLPVDGFWKGKTRFAWVMAGPRRAYVRYKFAGGLIAVDLAQKKVAWKKGLRPPR